jgi:hypothetical protein
LLPHFLLNSLNYLGKSLGYGLARGATAQGLVFVCSAELSV